MVRMPYCSVDSLADRLFFPSLMAFTTVCMPYCLAEGKADLSFFRQLHSQWFARCKVAYPAV